MTRIMTRWALVLVATAGLAVSTAPAQFMPGFRPGIYWVNPMTGARFGYNFNFNTALQWNAINPVTGTVTRFNYQTSWTGLPPGMYTRNVYNPYGLSATPYVSGGAGTYYNSNAIANPFVRDQVRMFAAAGDTNRVVDQGTGVGQRVIADQFNYERKGPADRPVAPANVNQSLLEPTEDQVFSGQVLNDLLGAIRGLETKGTRAESPFLPAELLTAVNLSSGANADVLMMLRGGRPVFPTVLSAPEWAGVKADLERSLTPVVDAVVVGKKADAGASERLTAAVRKARVDLAPAVRDATIQDGMDLVRFLNGLDILAKSAREPSQTGLFPAKWSTVGASVADLVQHMSRFQLAFAPASAGGEESYHSLHRGFVAYYVALSLAGR
jgi:hypothetical protein